MAEIVTGGKPGEFTIIPGSEDLPYDDELYPCETCGDIEDGCYCPNAHPPGGIP